VVGDRYTIVGVAEGAEATGDTLVYRASDARSFERCWSCGSTANGSRTRFCQNCGAPIQDHPVTLVQTRGPTGEAEEVEQDGHYFHVQPERRRFGAEGVGIEIGAYCAEGPHHPNEDSYWYVTQTLCANSQRLSTAIVVFADGMGGYAPGSGLISARIAATVGKQIFGALQTQAETADPLDSATAEAIVRQAIGAANTMVLDAIAHAGEMGSTLVVVLIHGDVAYVANIGDSRAYYVDPRGRATAITRDQSLVAQEVQQGHLAESDIYTAMGNNIILHAIGEEGVQDAADWYTQPLEPDSYLLVCSDGYWKTLRGAVVPDGGQGTREAGRNLSEQARRMVDTALTQGSDDNTTVVLVALS
jgi:protein phosphatase